MAISRGSQKPCPTCWNWLIAWPLIWPSKLKKMGKSCSCSPMTKPREASMATRPWVISDSRQRRMSGSVAVAARLSGSHTPLNGPEEVP
eukprot:357844-Chlamydomonas_euryale.AAC.5